MAGVAFDLELLVGVTGVAEGLDLEALAEGVGAAGVFDSVLPLDLEDRPAVMSISIESGFSPKLSRIFFFFDDSVWGVGGPAFLGGGVALGCALGLLEKATLLPPRIILAATLLLCSFVIDLIQASLNLLLSFAA